MRPIFTIHAGEFLFGEKIATDFRSIEVWIPAKDSGIDLLLANKSRSNTLAVQVKMSRDYGQIETLPDGLALESGGWFVFDRRAIEQSEADIWSLIVLSRGKRTKPIFINIAPKALLERLTAAHGTKESYHLYPQVSLTSCWEMRGLTGRRKRDTSEVPQERNWSEFLEDWSKVRQLIL